MAQVYVKSVESDGSVSYKLEASTRSARLPLWTRADIRRMILQIVLGISVISGLCIFALNYSYRVDPRPSILPLQKNDEERLLRQVREEASKDPAIAYAVSKFNLRGGRYIWASNDCSVFISDYLIKRGALSQGERITTKTLFYGKPTKLWHHYRQLGHIEPEVGDIVFYRYMDNNTETGHCGLIVGNRTNVVVVDNNAKSGKVTFMTWGAWKAIAFERNALMPGVKVARPIKDPI